MLIFLVSGLVLLLDQLAKFFITNQLSFGESLPVFEGIFHLTLVQNRGAAFGIFPHQTSFFILTSIFVIAFILISYPRLKNHSLFLQVGLSLILGGALGNLIDRLTFGFVVDYLDLRIWPVFNIADASICVGVGLCIIQLVKRR